MSGAQSFTERQIKVALRKGLGALAKKYNVDESYTEYIVGANGPRGARAAGVPIVDRHEAGVVERILDLAAIPSTMRPASRGGYWIYVPKIVGAR